MSLRILNGCIISNTLSIKLQLLFCRVSDFEVEVEVGGSRVENMWSFSLTDEGGKGIPVIIEKLLKRSYFSKDKIQFDSPDE